MSCAMVVPNHFDSQLYWLAMTKEIFRLSITILLNLSALNPIWKSISVTFEPVIFHNQNDFDVFRSTSYARMPFGAWTEEDWRLRDRRQPGDNSLWRAPGGQKTLDGFLLKIFGSS